jgi:hypothetical protein
MPTFLNTPFRLHRQVGVKNELGLRKVGVFIHINTPTFLRPRSFFTPTCQWRWNRQSVPKRRHIKFRRRVITQTKAYNKHNCVLICKAVYFCRKFRVFLHWSKFLPNFGTILPGRMAWHSIDTFWPTAYRLLGGYLRFISTYCPHIQS